VAEFGAKSKALLATCDPDLILVMERVVRLVDITIICGHRSEADQNAAVASGNSRARWPGSRHNATPSQAVDWAPWGPGNAIDWNDASRFFYVAGIIYGVAIELGIDNIRNGADWRRDGRTKGQTFEDLGHTELVKE